jgi:hypothetical protein
MRYKCGKRKLFYIDCEEEKDQELEETTPTICFHALVDINTCQTLKIEKSIKNK